MTHSLPKDALNKPVIPNASEESGRWATPRASIDAPPAPPDPSLTLGVTLVQSFPVGIQWRIGALACPFSLGNDGQAGRLSSTGRLVRLVTISPRNASHLRMRKMMLLLSLVLVFACKKNEDGEIGRAHV